MEGVWIQNIPWIHNVRPPRTDSRIHEERQCDPEQLECRIIFMTMSNDITWWDKENARSCELCSQISPAVIGHSWDLDQRRNGTELTLINQTETGTKRLRKWWLIRRNRPSDIPWFQRPWSRWITKQRGGKKTILFNGSEQSVEFILRTVTSVNQLSIYGAVADMCREASNDTMASRRNLKHMIFWKRWKFLLNPLLLPLIPMNSDGETWTIWGPEVIQTML